MGGTKVKEFGLHPNLGYILTQKIQYPHTTFYNKRICVQISIQKELAQSYHRVQIKHPKWFDFAVLGQCSKFPILPPVFSGHVAPIELIPVAWSQAS
jgi:hypothetical protein